MVLNFFLVNAMRLPVFKKNFLGCAVSVRSWTGHESFNLNYLVLSRLESGEMGVTLSG